MPHVAPGEAHLEVVAGKPVWADARFGRDLSDVLTHIADGGLRRRLELPAQGTNGVHMAVAFCHHHLDGEQGAAHRRPRQPQLLVVPVREDVELGRVRHGRLDVGLVVHCDPGMVAWVVPDGDTAALELQRVNPGEDGCPWCLT
jgi:hypothetical protein